MNRGASGMREQLAEGCRLSICGRRFRNLPRDQLGVHIGVQGQFAALNLVKGCHRRNMFTDGSRLKQCVFRNRRASHLRHTEPRAHSIDPLWMTAMLTPGT